MRIDAHHHFWTIGRYDYPWMGPELGLIQRDFGPTDLGPLLKQHEIDRTILVQTISSVDETRWFLTMAREQSFIAGVVGWVDLRDPAVGRVLDELQTGPGLVGIRHQVHDENDVNWLLASEVGRGLEALRRRKLAYDLLIRPVHLAPSLQVAQKHPDLKLVVDHIAKPRVAEGGWDDWAGGMRELAGCPNVWCKLSGMITEADWGKWKPSELKRYIDHVLEVFGPDRVMFGSDWPVCLLAGSYDRVIEALEVNTGHLSADERAKLFGLNAARFYGVDGAE